MMYIKYKRIRIYNSNSITNKSKFVFPQHVLFYTPNSNSNTTIRSLHVCAHHAPHLILYIYIYATSSSSWFTSITQFSHICFCFWFEFAIDGFHHTHHRDARVRAVRLIVPCFSFLDFSSVAWICFVMCFVLLRWVYHCICIFRGRDMPSLPTRKGNAFR